MAKFWFLTSDQAEKLLEVDPQLINVAKMSENFLTEINQLIQVTDTPKRKVQPTKPAQNMKNCGFQCLKRALIRRISRPCREKSLSNC